MALTTTPAAVIELWRALGLTLSDLTMALGVEPRSLERWRSGEAVPQREARKNLAALENLRCHILETFESPHDASKWLDAANRYLGGLTPADALRVRRPDRVEAALEALDSGVFV